MLGEKEYYKQSFFLCVSVPSSAFVASEQAVLVEFYAPWCGHCKRLAPEYAKAATTLKAQGIRIGKLDATEHGEVASRFGVSGYPTLKVFRSSKPTDYNGPREAAGIVSYMRKEAAPAFVELTSVAEAVEHAAKLGQPVVVGQYADAAAAKDFIAATAALRDHLFAVVYGAATESISLHFPTLPRYIATTNDAKYTGALSADKFGKWILESSLPAAGVNDAVSEHVYAASSVPVVTLYVPSFDTSKDPAGTKYFINRVKKVAKDYANKAVFAVADASKAPFEVLQSVAYTVGAVNADGLKFRAAKSPAKGFDKDALVAFTDAFLAGTLEPFMKSEDIPKEQGNVKVLVAKNFKAETEGKPGLIEFYAPWCGHCKSLAPTWDKLGDAVAAKTSAVVIGKMDATANDVPAGFDVTGFPTIYYVDAAGTKTKYQGGRELKDFTKFLKDKALF